MIWIPHPLPLSTLGNNKISHIYLNCDWVHSDINIFLIFIKLYKVLLKLISLRELSFLLGFVFRKIVATLKKKWPYSGNFPLLLFLKEWHWLNKNYISKIIYDNTFGIVSISSEVYENLARRSRSIANNLFPG